MADSVDSDPRERLTDLAHLSAGIGHHVINAYSAIVSNAELLRIGPNVGIPVDPAAVADVIIRTAIEASTVARRLIDFTRPSTAVDFAPIALHELVAGWVERERATCRPMHHWQTDIHPVPPILGNAEQIQSMLSHLIANAYEALSSAGGRLALMTGVDSRGWVTLELTDTGAGMTPEVLQRAVEPFFSTKPGRFGVGLTIANGIWRRQRGTMSIRSRPGEGTTLRLFIEPVSLTGPSARRD